MGYARTRPVVRAPLHPSRRVLALVALACASLAAPAAAQDARLRAFPQVPRSWDTARDYPIAQGDDGVRFAADELLLTLRPEARLDDVERDVDALGARVIGAVPSIRLVRVQLCDGELASAALTRFAALAGVELAELNGLGEGGQVAPPDDTHFASQWHHRNTGQSGGKIGADIQSLEAWSLSQGSSGVTLAVLDSGIDFGHPEFVGRVLPGFDFVNEDPDPTFDHSHGILVTGLAAANTGNGFAVAGVDGACSIVPVKVLNASNGGTVNDLVQGLDYCAQQGVDVVNLSLINYPATSALSNALAAARAAGCILVACAGNGGIGDANVSWPGASPLTISVGATDRFDVRADFSGTGNALDVVAPGEAVATSSSTHSDVFSLFSGCSAATPVAAGIVCLLKAAQPGLTHDQAQHHLLIGAEDQVGPPNEDFPGKDPNYGWGRVNAWRSLASLAPCVPPLSYGLGKTTSLGTMPSLSTSGEPAHSYGDFSIHVAGGIPGAVCVLMSGSGQAALQALGGTLWLASPIVRLDDGVLDAAGAIAFPLEVEAAMVGTSGYYQVFLRDLAHPDGTGAGLSDALEVTYCP